MASTGSELGPVVDRPSNRGPALPVLDLAIVVVIVFILHRLLVTTLAGPVLWWLYYPVLGLATVGYLRVRRSPVPTGVSRRRVDLRSAMVGILAGLGVVALVWLIGAAARYGLYVAGELPDPDVPWWAPLRPGGQVAWPVMVMALTAGPFIEEYIFRGVLYAGLLQRVRPAWAAVVSSAAFAALHGSSKAAGSFLFGLVAAGIYRRTGSLLAAVLAHATMNGTLLLISVVLRSAGWTVSPV
jgi:membrane protease YdiL (CAAX protease family)